MSTVTENTRQDDVRSVGLVQTQTVTLFEAPDLLHLECGRTLGPIQVAYETYGQLNAERTNAVLICHALTGDAHVAGRHTPTDRKPGWWEIMVGPGKGIDTDKYFVICSNVLGGCKGTTGPSSINPETGRPWGLDFPVVTIEDMVKVQKRLIEHLGIEKLLCVTGGSMGGMQVLEWTVRYPDSVASAIPIATTARLNAQSIAFDAVGRNAVLADGNFANGQYHGGPAPDRGLAIARMVGHITYLSEQGMHEKFGRELRGADKYSYDFGNEFSVETYLDHQGRIFVERFDANSYLYITKAVDYYDLAARNGTLDAAFRNARAKYLLLSFSSDWLFPPAQSRQIVDALLATGRDVSYSEISSPYGHDAFLLEPEILGRLIGGFLARASGHPALENGHDDSPYRQAPDIEPAWGARRVDYDRIEELIEPGSTILDVGCGRGVLLNRLVRAKGAQGLGVEVSQHDICECIDRGLPVVDLDIDTELTSFADQSWDYVVLSQTLQTVRQPERVLREIVRIGRYGIVSFPNFACWRPTLQMLITGRTPVTRHLPFRWYNTPNLHYLSIRDFEDFCHKHGIAVLRKIALAARRRAPIRLLANRRAREAIFVISRA
jgi:homoserine O-acetyltransferase/O-succinyltransferase